MTRRQLDIILASGGIIFAVLVLALGLVAKSQADFAKQTMKDQLGEQKITFTPAANLTDQEKTWKSGSQCLIDNAEKVIETGAQAECYADYYIALHLEEAANNAGYPGATYATIGTTQRQLQAKVADAKAKNDPGLADLQKQLDTVNSLRNTQFQGETLRGLLLTSYGFGILGDRAALAGVIAFGMAALAAVLGLAGFVHAFVTPKDQPVLRHGLTPAPTPTK